MNSMIITDPVSFLPFKTLIIKVRYTNPSGHHGALASSKKKTMLQVYRLTPAGFWDDDAKVGLEVIMPSGTKTAVNSNIPLTTNDKPACTAVLDSIPNHEWIISYKETGLSDDIYMITGISSRMQWLTLIFIVLAAAAYVYLKGRRAYGRQGEN